jgi:nucleoside phosphorylase
MEGAGLYAASTDRNVDWILVKAICDFADGKKRFKKHERQAEAARQAANFVFHAIGAGGFGKSLNRATRLN